MLELLCPILELSVVIPGIFLAYLPTSSYLKQPLFKLFSWLVPLLLTLCITGGLICYVANASTGIAMLLLTSLIIWIYIHTLDISHLKSISVALAICAVFTCVNSLSRAVNAMMTMEVSPWFSAGAGIVYNLLCWLFVLLAWYPATHAAKKLIEHENMAETWYFFWILPLVFVGLNLFMIPRYEGTLYQGRIMQGYIVISLMLLVILALLYAMFLAMANSLNKNARLEQEKQFFMMQQSRYESLFTTIEEVRHARHDMRHHFQQLSALAESGNLDSLKQYLKTATGRMPSINLHFSNNLAADSVISHYYAIAERELIPFSVKVNLPDQLPVDDIDLCLVLSNLLENAIEASMRTEQKRRHINMEIYLHSTNLILILVENAYGGTIKEKNGLFRSSKRKGNGIGIQSIRRIADKNGGDSSFFYENGEFTAKVMLRGNSSK